MGIKAIIVLVIILFFVTIAFAISFNWILIGISPSLATFVLGVLGVGAFLLGAGAVLPRDGRAGLTTMAIGSSLLILSGLSTITISLS